jgi:hypothetical protein
MVGTGGGATRDGFGITDMGERSISWNYVPVYQITDGSMCGLAEMENKTTVAVRNSSGTFTPPAGCGAQFAFSSFHIAIAKSDIRSRIAFYLYLKSGRRSGQGAASLRMLLGARGRINELALEPSGQRQAA